MTITVNQTYDHYMKFIGFNNLIYIQGVHKVPGYIDIF